MWRKPQVWLGFIVSAIALVWAFGGIEWSKLGDALRDAQYIYLIPAIVSLLVAMLIRAERWRWLYGERRHNLNLGRAFSVLSIGYLITNTFPLRLGEVARTIFIARDGKVTIAHTASTIVVEHVLDVLTVLGILVVLLAGRSVPLPDWAIQGAVLSAWAFGGALIVMLIMVWQRVRIERWAEQILEWIPRLYTQTWPWRLIRIFVMGLYLMLLRQPAGRLATQLLFRITHPDKQKWLQRVAHILDGFAVLQPGRPLIVIVFWSITGWLCSALTFQLALLAFIPNPPFIISLFVTVTSTFALLLPATPGAIGVLQGSIVLSLAIFNIPKETALSFAIVFHVMEIIVMDLVGAIALWREAGSWAAMKAQLRSVTSAS